MQEPKMAGLIDPETNLSLTLTSSSLLVNIDGFISSVLASLSYFNQFDHEVQGLFVYADSRTELIGLRASVGNRKIRMEIRDRVLSNIGEENSVSIEEKPQRVLAIRMGKIPPYANVVLEINVVGELQTVNREALTFKTAQVFTPFYSRSSMDGTSGRREFADCGNVGSCCVNSQPYAFDMKIRAGMPCLLSGCLSPSHAIRVDADVNATSAETVIVTLAEKYKYDQEIEVLFYLSQPLESYVAIEAGRSLNPEKKVQIYSGDFLNDAVIALSFIPDLPKGTVFGEFVFMVDRSGSMNGSHICIARESLLLLLKSLPTSAYFNLVSFGSYSRTLFPSSQPYNQENLEKACAYVSSIRADMGGSELLQPLKVVLEQPPRVGYARNIFLLTDGDVSHAGSIVEYLHLNSQKARIFAFGIGPKISYDIVSDIASAGQGEAYFAPPGAKIQKEIVKCLRKTLQPTLCNIKVDWQLPESFRVRRFTQEIPSASHGQRLNIFASVSAPPGNWQQSEHTVQEMHFNLNGVKEFWFDEDFDSCKLGDNNSVVEDPSDVGEFPRHWDSDCDTDICSQCSDYQPLVSECEEYFSETEAVGGNVESKSRGDDRMGYTDQIGCTNVDTDANDPSIASYTTDIYLNPRPNTDTNSSTSTGPDSRINAITNNNQSPKYDYIIDKGPFYDSDAIPQACINPNSHTLSCANNIFKPDAVIYHGTCEHTLGPLDCSSVGQRKVRNNNVTPSFHGTANRISQDLVAELNSLSRKISQPSLTHLYNLPPTSSHNLVCCQNPLENKSVGKSCKNLSCLSYHGNLKPSNNDDYARSRSSTTEGNSTFCSSQSCSCYPCRCGIAIVSGFLGTDVFRKIFSFCLKPRLLTTHRYDLHQMAALSFIRSMEAMLEYTKSDDAMKKEIIELSKSSGVPSRLTSQVTVDQRGKIIGAAQHSLYSSNTRERSQSLLTYGRRLSKKFTRSQDEPPAILVSSPSIEEDPRSPTKRRHGRTANGGNLSDEEGKYYHVERLSPEGSDDVELASDISGPHYRKRFVNNRHIPMKTIQRHKMVSARLILLTRKMKDVQKLNVFAGPPFIRLILLQAAEGFWELTYAFAKIVGLPLVQLELAAPFADCTMIPFDQQDVQLGIDCYYDSLALWATAIALVYFERKWKSYESEWELIAQKADIWLKNQTFPQGFTYLDVMLAARQAVGLLEQKYRSRATSEPINSVMK